MNKSKTTPRPSLEELIPDKTRREEILSRLYKGDPLLGGDGIFTDMLQAMVNAALEGELDNELKEKLPGSTNRRNGHIEKEVKSSVGPLTIRTPRDRTGDFEPVMVKKWSRDLDTGIDNIILSFYARGQSIEDIRYQLKQIYGLEVSSGVISAVTDRVWEAITEWQTRTLHSCYPIVYLDAIHYKVRDSGQVKSKAIYTCYGINCEGERDVLGLYLEESEGSRHWGLILEDLKRRGLEDVFIFCVDGLKGFKDVIGHVYPDSIVQRCIVHMIRSSTRFISYKDLKKVCSDLRKIYTSANKQQAEVALEAFGSKWNKKYPEVQRKWLDEWDDLMAFMDYESNIRRMIYTTNPVEALHRVMRKITKSKGAWTSEKGLIKQLYLALMYNEKSWKRKSHSWSSIQRELIEKFEDRYEKHLK